MEVTSKPRCWRRNGKLKLKQGQHLTTEECNLGNRASRLSGGWLERGKWGHRYCSWHTISEQALGEGSIPGKSRLSFQGMVGAQSCNHTMECTRHKNADARDPSWWHCHNYDNKKCKMSAFFYWTKLFSWLSILLSGRKLNLCNLCFLDHWSIFFAYSGSLFSGTLGLCLSHAPWGGPPRFCPVLLPGIESCFISGLLVGIHLSISGVLISPWIPYPLFYPVMDNSFLAVHPKSDPWTIPQKAPYPRCQILSESRFPHLPVISGRALVNPQVLLYSNICLIPIFLFHDGIDILDYTGQHHKIWFPPLISES